MFASSIKIVLIFVIKGPVKHSIGSDNGVWLKRRQAINWTDDGLVHTRTYISFD